MHAFAITIFVSSLQNERFENENEKSAATTKLLHIVMQVMQVCIVTLEYRLVHNIGFELSPRISQIVK